MEATISARWLLLVLEASTIPAALALGWLLGHSPLAEFAWRVDALVLGIAATVPLVAVLAISVRWRLAALEPMLRVVEELLVPLFRGWSLGELALVAALAGVGEEMLFRGVVQTALAARLGPAWGIVLAGALFGAVHSLNVAYFLFATLVGIYLGTVFEFSGNLLAAMAAHGAYDFAAIVYLVRRRPLN